MERCASDSYKAFCQKFKLLFETYSEGTIRPIKWPSIRPIFVRINKYIFARISRKTHGWWVSWNHFKAITRKSSNLSEKPKTPNLAKRTSATSPDWPNFKVFVLYWANKNIDILGGPQDRLNEFLESREKMKQIMSTQLEQKRTELLQKFEAERLKLLTGKLTKKQDEGK